MTTAADIITLALKDAQIIDENETPSAALMADALKTLNQLFGMWQLTGINVPATTEITFTPTGAASYTIGPSGVVVAVKPQRINYAFLVVNGVSYPMAVILPTREDFESYAITSVVATFPDVVYYSNDVVNGTLFVYPQPNAGTMRLGVDLQLPSYTLAPDAFSLDIGYEMPVRFNLAKILLTMMGRPVTTDINDMAKTSLAVLQRSNVRVRELSIDGLGNRTEKSDFYSGFLR